MANKSITKALSLMLAVWIAFTNFVPLTVLADDVPYTINLDDIILDTTLETSANTSGGKYSYDTNTRIITINSGPVTITGRTASRRVIVAQNTTVEVTLEGVYIDVSLTPNAVAFLLNTGAKVTITLSDDNTLKSGSARAGLEAGANTELTITGTDADSLTATTTGDGGAGIGGGYDRAGGTINISGGTVNANGSKHVNSNDGGAGIGGGSNRAGGIINITGGTVNANSNSSGAGIGGGSNGAGGIINITGGTVNADSRNGGAGIGGGSNGAGGIITISGGTVNANSNDGGAGIGGGYTGASGTINITGGSVNPTSGVSDQPTSTSNTPVYLNTLTVGEPIVGGKVAISSITVDGVPSSYGLNDVVTDADGKVYFWLSQNNTATASVSVVAGDGSYRKTYMRNTTAQTNTLLLFAVSNVTFPTASDITYGQTLAQSNFSGGTSGRGTFAWEDDSIKPLVGNSEYTVVFMPNCPAEVDYSAVPDWDSTSQTVRRKVTINVAKATAPTPTGLTATYGDTLSSVTLPSDWTWVEVGTTPVGACGTKTHNANYIDTTGNYNDASNVPLNITVNKAAQNAPTGLGKTDETVIGNDGTITGITTDMEYKLSTDSSYTPCSNADITGLAPGTYYVRYAETANYNASGDTQVIIAAYKAPLAFVYNAAYDIPASTVGMAIADINVSGGASGGIPPYTFGATGLPAGISISTAGIISGVPTSAEPSGTATITVTDNAGASENITISFGAISAAVISYTVTFVDWNNAIFSVQTIEHGKSAIAPATPTRDGYTFIGWDTDFSIVTSNLTVNAVYMQNELPTPKYTVTFVDWNNAIFSVQTIEHGKSAIAPATPTRDGYTFIGWDTDFSIVTSNLTVTARYRQNTQPSGEWTPLPQFPSSPQPSGSNQPKPSATQTPAYRIITIKDRNGNVLDSFDTSVLSMNGKILTLKPSKQSNNYVFSFSLQCLKELETAMKGGKFKIVLSGVEYELPFNVASIITGLSNYLRNENLQDYALELTITKLTGDELTKAQEAFKQAYPDGEMPDAFYDISFGLYKNGKKVNYNANRFNSAVTFGINTTRKCNAVLEYNPTTGKFSFVPAKFGENKSRVNTRHHSIYAAVKNNVTFSDVKAGAWYEPYVTAAANMALVEGYNGLFDPERAVTRAEFVQMIANAMQLPAAKDGTKEYSDVTETAWYYDAIMRANSAELLNGFTDDGFKPDEAITREEMASILASIVRSAKLSTMTEGTSLEQMFVDFDDMSVKYRSDIELVYSAKLMDGVGNNCFNPKGSTTRAQAATVQIRLLELLNMIE